MSAIVVYATLLILNVMLLAVFFCQLGDNENHNVKYQESCINYDRTHMPDLHSLGTSSASIT